MSVQPSQADESRCSPGEEKEHGNIIAGPIDISKAYQVTGPRNLMELSTADRKAALERERYIEQQRSSQTPKIICDAGKLGRIIHEMADETTRDTLCDVDAPSEAYYAAVSQYLKNYMWQIGDHCPTSDAKLWEIFDGRAAEYLQAIKIRDSSTSTGREIKRNFLTESRGRGKYAALDYAQ